MPPLAPLRPLPLPEPLPGRLFLSAMPGRLDPLEVALAAMRQARIGHVLCLAETAEIAAKSPAYAAALAAGRWPARLHQHGIADFGVPADAAAFAQWLGEAAELLRQGEHLLLHCAAGIGRTGMAALCLLHRLGLPAARAACLVRAAGSWPETPAQRAFVASFTADA